MALGTSSSDFSTGDYILVESDTTVDDCTSNDVEPGDFVVITDGFTLDGELHTVDAETYDGEIKGCMSPINPGKASISRDDDDEGGNGNQSALSDGGVNDDEELTHECTACGRAKHIDSEPKTTKSWCDDCGTVTEHQWMGWQDDK